MRTGVRPIATSRNAAASSIGSVEDVDGDDNNDDDADIGEDDKRDDAASGSWIVGALPLTVAVVALVDIDSDIIEVGVDASPSIATSR